MTDEEKELILDLKKCDFREISSFYKQKVEEAKTMSKEEKLVCIILIVIATKAFSFPKLRLIPIVWEQNVLDLPENLNVHLGGDGRA